MTIPTPCLRCKDRPHCSNWAVAGSPRCSQCTTIHNRRKERDGTRKAQKAAKAPAYRHVDYRQMKALVRDTWIKCSLPTCNKRADTVDHIVSIVKGGAHTADNLQPMCAHCNYSLGAKDKKKT